MSGPLQSGSTGKIDVNVSDQTTRPIIVKFNQVSNSTALSIAAVKDAYTITVDSTTGFVDGKYIILFNPDSEKFGFYTQLGAPAVNVITLDTPLDFAYPSGTFVDTAITNMNVDGSSTTQTFGLRGTGAPPGVDLTMDVTRIIFDCTGTSAMDLSKFGNLDALLRGLVLKVRNGTTENIFNVKTNGALASIMYDLDIFSAGTAGKGIDGFKGRLTFAGQSKIGVAIRLPIGEDLEVLIQDDLQLLTTLGITAEGHLVEDR